MADTCGQVLLGSGLTVLSHPLMYIKVLVQVGHEPLPPSLGRNLFGRQVYQLPGLFAYAKHIIKIDGKAGLFNGLAPRLCAGTIGTLVHSRVLQRCQDAGKYEVSGPSQKAEEGSLQHVVNETTKEMIARSCATIVTHPFHVITLRCMVQFIGRETKYSGVFDSIVTVYKNEGVLGFFAGLIPRLLGDVLSLWICNMLAHLINTYAIDDSMSHTGEIKNCSQAVTGVSVKHVFLNNEQLMGFLLGSSVAVGGEWRLQRQGCEFNSHGGPVLSIPIFLLLRGYHSVKSAPAREALWLMDLALSGMATL
uniref:Mitochondrial carrier homolog 2 n=1 Tax=Salmo trutta TaxID=8032 RepID=A0A673X9L3_SALTR